MELKERQRGRKSRWLRTAEMSCRAVDGHAKRLGSDESTYCMGLPQVVGRPGQHDAAEVAARHAAAASGGA